MPRTLLRITLPILALLAAPACNFDTGSKMPGLENDRLQPGEGECPAPAEQCAAVCAGEEVPASDRCPEPECDCRGPEKICTSDSDCESGLRCNARELCAPPPGCSPDEPCASLCSGFCVPISNTSCSQNSDCDEDEVCGGPFACLQSCFGPYCNYFCSGECREPVCMDEEAMCEHRCRGGILFAPEPGCELPDDCECDDPPPLRCAILDCPAGYHCDLVCPPCTAEGCLSPCAINCVPDVAGCTPPVDYCDTACKGQEPPALPAECPELDCQCPVPPGQRR